MKKRILALVLSIAMVLSFIPFSAFAADMEATITFDNKTKRTEYSTTKQVWEENGIKVTNNKASSSSNVADYAKPARFYASSLTLLRLYLMLTAQAMQQLLKTLLVLVLVLLQ